MKDARRRERCADGIIKNAIRQQVHSHDPQAGQTAQDGHAKPMPAPVRTKHRMARDHDGGNESQRHANRCLFDQKRQPRREADRKPPARPRVT